MFDINKEEIICIGDSENDKHMIEYAGLNIIIQMVVTKQRVRSQEFIDFLKFFNAKGVAVSVSYEKPVGAWEGNFDALVDKYDMDYVRELEKNIKYLLI